MVLQVLGAFHFWGVQVRKEDGHKVSKASIVVIRVIVGWCYVLVVIIVIIFVITSTVVILVSAI